MLIMKDVYTGMNGAPCGSKGRVGDDGSRSVNMLR